MKEGGIDKLTKFILEEKKCNREEEQENVHWTNVD
jgi:hypothetical protein